MGATARERQPDYLSRRLRAVRSFARYLHALDPACEIRRSSCSRRTSPAAASRDFPDADRLLACHHYNKRPTHSALGNRPPIDRVRKGHRAQHLARRASRPTVTTSVSPWTVIVCVQYCAASAA